MEHTIWAKHSAMYWVSINGNVITFGERKGYLKPQLSNWGYHRVNLKAEDGSCRYWRVHRLVATLFIKKTSSLQVEVNHDDGVKVNNRIENLIWSSKSNNLAHAHRTGLAKASTAPKKGLHKLTSEQCKEVRASSLTNVALGKLFGCSPTTISRVKNNQFSY